VSGGTGSSSGGPGVFSTLTVTGNSTLEGTVRLSNNQPIEWGGTNNYITGNELSDYMIFATNGSERLRVTAAGDFGVGTSIPNSRFQIVTTDVTTGTILTVGPTSDTMTSGTVARFTSNETTHTGNIVEIIQDYASTTAIPLYVRQDGTGDIVNIFDTTVEVFTVANGGFIGILDSSPSYNLDVNGTFRVTGAATFDTVIGTANLGSGTASTTTFLRGDNTWGVPVGSSSSPGGSDTQVQYNDSGAFEGDAGLTYIASTDSLTVDGGGVFNDGSNALDFRIESDDNATMFFINGASDKIGLGTDTLQDATVTIGDTVTNNAYVWIDGNHSSVTLDRTNTSYDTGIKWATNGATANFRLGQMAADDILNVYVDSLDSDIFTWKNDGNIGINDTTPTYKLDLNGTFHAGWDACCRRCSGLQRRWSRC